MSDKGEKSMKPVVVSTDQKGVFFGYLPEYEKNKTEKTVTIKDARMCIKWSASIHGFNGLASTGPNKECRVSPKVPEHTLQGVTSIMLCSDLAAKAWESEPWN